MQKPGWASKSIVSLVLGSKSCIRMGSAAAGSSSGTREITIATTRESPRTSVMRPSAISTCASSGKTTLKGASALSGTAVSIGVGAGVPVGASVSSASGQEKVIREKRSIRQSSRVMRRMVMHLRQKQFRVFIIPHLRADVNLRNVTLPFRGKL